MPVWWSQPLRQQKWELWGQVGLFQAWEAPSYLPQPWGLS